VCKILHSLISNSKAESLPTICEPLVTKINHSEYLLISTSGTKVAEQSARRVEDGRGGRKPRFPSPLIKPDVRNYRIRLSDWLHLMAHSGRQFSSALANVSPIHQIPSPMGTDGCLVTATYAAAPESASHDYRRFVLSPDTPAGSIRNCSIDTILLILH
jgi:hypothetical protein